MTQPEYIRNLNALGRDEPLIEHTDDLEDELYASGSDRAIGVIFGSFLERNLERLLLANLRQDLNAEERNRIFGADGFAGTFGSKVTLASAMSLIGHSTKKDLNLIRLIRNAFAHSLLPCSFSTPAISEACKHFVLFNLPGIITIPLRYLDSAPQLERFAPIPKDDAKSRFIVTCHCLMGRISMKRDGPMPGDEAFPGHDPLP